jgi:alkaline phosphatase D
MPSRTTRREALAAGLAGGAALLLPPAARAVPVLRRPELRGGRFLHGVASGLPSTSGTTLWTRVSEVERSGRLTLEVARDADFARVVQRRPVAAVSWRDFTARATVGGLPPGEQFFFRFATRDGSSPVGRFRTLRPADSREPVRIGFFSCQKWTTGFYPAHAALAAEEDLDLVVSLGDYIYETGGRGVRPDTTGANRDGNVQTLGEYRQKYALHRSDPDLQAMHAAHPFAATWDDHELENDYHGASSPARPRRISYEERKRQAYLAFFEWMPRFRLPAEPSRVYGSIPLGGLAELLLVDTRQHRDPPPCGGVTAQPCLEPDPGRTFLGAAQKAWLKERLAASPAAWKLLGNQTMMMGLEAPPKTRLNPDQWDGYPREREELLRHLLDRGIRDVAVLTGDIHAFFAGEVHPTGSGPESSAAATEFVGGSISSGGFEEEVGPALPAFTAGIRANNPHIKDVELSRRGFGVVEARPDELLVTFKGVDTVARRGVPASVLGRYRVPRGQARVEVLQAAS